MFSKILQYTINEISNSLKFNELSNIFPHNVMKIYESNECKNSNSNDIFNLFVIEKVRGITLNEYINILDLNQGDDVTLFISLLLQSIYVIMYANKNGYYHNDIKMDNLMVYELQDLDSVTLNNLVIDNHQIVLTINKIKNKLILIKFIDFGQSQYVESSDSLHEVYLTTMTFFNAILRKISPMRLLFFSTVQALRTAFVFYFHCVNFYHFLLLSP